MFNLRTPILAGSLLLGTALAGSMALAATPPDTLVIATSIDDMLSMDPAQSFEISGGDQINNVYETLVDVDPVSLQPIPGLASEWSVSEDGRTFTFKMQEGRKFASGNPVRAQDAAWSLQRVVKLDLTPAFIITQFGLTKENVEQNVRATDDMTLVIQTDRPFAPTFLTNALTASAGSVVDMETVMQHAEGEDLGNKWLSQNSAGSGAYTLRSWTPNEAIILEANPNWDRAADLQMKRVFVRHVAEPATQRLLLEQGDVDMVRNLTPTDIEAISNVEGLKVQDSLRGLIYYLGANQNNEILKNPKVVEAIKYLVDYEGLTNTLLKGRDVVHQSFLPQGFLGEIKDNPYKLDVEKAKALLAEAGYPDGFPIEFLMRNEQERIDIGQALQGTMAQAGITLNLRPVVGSEALEIYRARNHELTLQTWGTDYPDPHTNASVFASNPDNSADAKLVGNLAWRNAYAAAETTPMVEAAVVEQDEAKRRAMYEEMQRIAQATSPLIPLFQQIEQTAMQANVDGFQAGGAVESAYYWPVTKAAAQ